ncbi:MAG: PH domain-containing protein [Xanthomonadales bacterium]|jgi:hypothetical protein|nr:PH domain-containing protein [Xanthomonadales bacterium]
MTTPPPLPLDPAATLAFEPALGRLLQVQSSIGFGLIGCGIWIAALIFTDPGWRLGPLLLLALLALGAVAGWRYGTLAHARARYGVDEVGVRLCTGVWFRSAVVVPRDRIQYVDLKQGPLERWLGLSTLCLHTAGQLHPVVELVGLSPETAAALREQLALPASHAPV